MQEKKEEATSTIEILRKRKNRISIVLVSMSFVKYQM